MNVEDKILAALADSGEPMSGAQIGRSTRTWSADLYPALGKLEKAGRVMSGWEGGSGEGSYARRRLYRLPSA